MQRHARGPPNKPSPLLRLASFFLGRSFSQVREGGRGKGEGSRGVKHTTHLRQAAPHPRPAGCNAHTASGMQLLPGCHHRAKLHAYLRGVAALQRRREGRGGGAATSAGDRHSAEARWQAHPHHTSRCTHRMIHEPSICQPRAHLLLAAVHSAGVQAGVAPGSVWRQARRRVSEPAAVAAAVYEDEPHA